MQHTECKGCKYLQIIGNSYGCEQRVHQSIIKGLPYPAFGVCDFYKTDFSR
jgi:hypothetical protein